MAIFLNNVYRAIRSPKELFSAVSDKKDLKTVFFIVSTLSLLMTASFYLHPSPYTPTKVITEEQKKLFANAFPIFMGIVFFLVCYILLIVESFIIQISFMIMKIKKQFSIIISVMVYTQVPMLPSLIMNLFLPHLSEKLSIAFLIERSWTVTPGMQRLLHGVGLFSIWGLILDVIAISSIGNLTYKKSIAIVSVLWAVTFIIPNLPYLQL
jgi:hypothetical protein